MSRSKRKTPIHGIAIGSSEKEDKRHLHGIERSQQRQVLSKILKEELDPDEVTFYTVDEALDKWSMSKDGKSYWHKQSRFPEMQEWWDEYYEKAMRK